jgi:hypothetical protein
MFPRLTFPPKLTRQTGMYLAVWLLCLGDWMWGRSLDVWWRAWPEGLWFSLSVPLAAYWIAWAGWLCRLEEGEQASLSALRQMLGDLKSVSHRLEALASSSADELERSAARSAFLVRRHLVWSLSAVFLWQFAVFITDAADWHQARVNLATWGTVALFFLGLVWVVWIVERGSQFYEQRRYERLQANRGQELDFLRSAHRATRDDEAGEERVHNPLDPHAWYFGRRQRRLNQSLSWLTAYSFCFMIAFLVFTQIGGCSDLYELPAGGGQQAQIAQAVKIQKIIKKKFVVNPFSAISFKVPPIDEIKLQLQEITQHAYTVGYGEGSGAGFAGGTNAGKVRFLRLEYSGGDWDQDMSFFSGENMLREYGLRTKQKTNDKEETRTIAQLKAFPAEKSPPFVYLTGEKNISISSQEAKTLREYLLDKHGMLFIDNGGSGHFHNQVLAMMRQVLPNVRPSQVPLDDVIHRIPYPIPFLPYVAPHGGKEALGWRVDGRLVAYYHPGDIGDAWADGHAGVKPEITEFCYQLGVNVIYYAHAEYSKWLSSRTKK